MASSAGAPRVLRFSWVAVAAARRPGVEYWMIKLVAWSALSTATIISYVFVFILIEGLKGYVKICP